MAAIAFDNSYARDLTGLFAAWQPTAVARPKTLYFNGALAQELGLDPADFAGDLGANTLAGNALPAGAQPIAQAYAGHQFGSFSPQLGDGRALLLGEVIDQYGVRRDIAFKGSGRTPFSRRGDGKAAVGPMLREVLMGEAMHALGIPTTRALAVVATGEPVYRETVLPGAVLTRVASSHIRVGTFEYFAAREDIESLRRLADYTISRHDPQFADARDRYLALLKSTVGRQAKLIAQWMNVGFIHGVMNTDNMVISGETIDYGPCAFMEAHNPGAVFSSIDEGGRYAYGNQPGIAQWNLTRFAEALMPLMGEDTDAVVAQCTEALNGFASQYYDALLNGQRAKLGLKSRSAASEASDQQLAADWLNLLSVNAVDFTLAWYHLADATTQAAPRLESLFTDPTGLRAWLARWRERCALEDAASADSATARPSTMRRVNPYVIPRNHKVEEALTAASASGDLVPFERLLAAIKTPYADEAFESEFASPAPPELTACYKTFCGT